MYPMFELKDKSSMSPERLSEICDALVETGDMTPRAKVALLGMQTADLEFGEGVIPINAVLISDEVLEADGINCVVDVTGFCISTHAVCRE